MASRNLRKLLKAAERGYVHGDGGLAVGIGRATGVDPSCCMGSGMSTGRRRRKEAADGETDTASQLCLMLGSRVCAKVGEGNLESLRELRASVPGQAALGGRSPSLVCLVQLWCLERHSHLL